MATPVSVCFVCLGNICRSPTAEAVMRKVVNDAGLGALVTVDSAGTSAYHVGESPDPRSIAAARRRGIHMEGAARQFRVADWDRFDYVVAMDALNYQDLERSAPSDAHRRRLFLARSFDPASPPGAGVPDPYYSSDGFDEVLGLCEAACEGLLRHVVKEHGLSK